MTKEYISGSEGKNLKFKRETLLNYGMNRWGLNKTSSVGKMSELIRDCSPSTFEEWENYYFENARQCKKEGIKITREYITNLGKRLFTKLSEIVHKELSSITEEECIDYAYNLILNRTYEGYDTEKQTIYGKLQIELKEEIKPAPDQWDRTYNVDFYLERNKPKIGFQIKPIGSGKSINDYQWETMHEKNHKRFTKDFGGKVFFIYSVKGNGKNKEIYNKEVIEEIKKEIKRIENGN